ncbi:MAG TPA: TetR family transcriptional regulator [Acidimicrobiales bacterium]|nr:TetR family transcriptional regulator [Acidimicrobiales bacterium]
MVPAGRRTQAQRSATTRQAIIDSARRLFAEEGFAEAGLDRIVAAAGVTRGALYHHFDTKVDVFAAVVEQVDRELFDAVVRAGRAADDPVAWIRRAARAYVEARARSTDGRIVADLPAVLGPDEYRRISAARCLPLAQLAGAAAAAGGVELPGDPNVLAAMLLAALEEAVTLLGGEHPPSKRAVLRTVDALLDRVLGVTPVG